MSLLPSMFLLTGLANPSPDVHREGLLGKAVPTAIVGTTPLGGVFLSSLSRVQTFPFLEPGGFVGAMQVKWVIRHVDRGSDTRHGECGLRFPCKDECKFTARTRKQKKHTSRPLDWLRPCCPASLGRSWTWRMGSENVDIHTTGLRVRIGSYWC